MRNFWLLGDAVGIQPVSDNNAARTRSAMLRANGGNGDFCYRLMKCTTHGTGAGKQQ
jgi:hypothetical protein